MRFLLDAQLSPALCQYIADRFSVEVNHVIAVGLVPASDMEIFRYAREHQAIVITKDRDFLELSRQHGTPPQVICIRSGNTSNAMMKWSINAMFPDVLRLLSEGEGIVELRCFVDRAGAPEPGERKPE
jgi:predicted nuclease of predicted toxin-antitoxin system